MRDVFHVVCVCCSFEGELQEDKETYMSFVIFTLHQMITSRAMRWDGHGDGEKCLQNVGRKAKGKETCGISRCRRLLKK
jgi:hypothetical protein